MSSEPKSCWSFIVAVAGASAHASSTTRASRGRQTIASRTALPKKQSKAHSGSYSYLTGYKQKGGGYFGIALYGAGRRTAANGGHPRGVRAGGMWPASAKTSPAVIGSNGVPAGRVLHCEANSRLSPPAHQHQDGGTPGRAGGRMSTAVAKRQAFWKGKRGEAQQTQLAISLALRRKGGGALPWGFIRFSRCQFSSISSISS